MKSSSVTFLSLGPGDPELLTLQAVKALRSADVVLLPATRTAAGVQSSRAAEIVGEWCPRERQRFYPLPMSADRLAVMKVYDEMYSDILHFLSEGRNVVVGVEGDISIYASIHYVQDRLCADGIEVRQLPGIPSFIAAASCAALSLVSQQERLLVIPGDCSAEELLDLLHKHYTIVLMKLSHCRKALTTLLQDNNSVECHYIENVGLPSEYYSSDSPTILSRQMPYFSLAILKLR